MAIPTRYRERLVSRCEGQLICTVDVDHCLLIYPLPDWEEMERRLMRMPNVKPGVRRLQRLMVGYASEMDLDGHGRVLVPRELRDFASLQRQAVLIGQGSKFELWDESRWNESRDAWLAEADRDGAGLPAELESLSL